MSDPIRRHKTPDEFTAEEHLAAIRGEDPPESDEYIEKRREALEGAGLEDDTEVTDPNQMTPQQHLKRIQEGK
jgi:hypothetical protein